MTLLTCTDPVRKIDRYYVVDITPTLFGEFALLSEWGAAARPGHSRARGCLPPGTSGDKRPDAVDQRGSAASLNDRLHQRALLTAAVAVPLVWLMRGRPVEPDSAL